jgi:murein DD-endopeptidase MepM/ murein hydrolase activator NlpD
MRRQPNSLSALFLMVVALGGFGFLLWSNAEITPPLEPIVPTEFIPTDDPNSWENLLRQGFGDNSTPLPTIAIPTEPFIAPTLALSGDTNVIPINPASVNGLATATPFGGATPTLPLPTSGLVLTQLPITEQAVTRPPSEWRPPPLLPPLSRDPMGRDHYWFQRPVDSNANNAGLFYYPFGSNGIGDENSWRVHTGIDMPNPVGETVRAAASGEVIWAADGLRVEEGGPFQNSASYGNVIVIQHDFGFRGQPIWTLYAHLSAALVRRGQYVNAGEVIGLVGATGRVSGPHVHFEIRMGENHLRATYNPVLWMVPYVGTGVIAGRVVDFRGDRVQDVTVTVNRWAIGLVQDTSSTYIFENNGLDVNTDPNWDENFVVGDLPVGRYEVVVTIDGERVSKLVDVLEGTTSFVELLPEQPPTPQPVTEGS